MRNNKETNDPYLEWTERTGKTREMESHVNFVKYSAQLEWSTVGRQVEQLTLGASEKESKLNSMSISVASHLRFKGRVLNEEKNWGKLFNLD